MAQPGTLNIGVCQIFALDGDREGNFVRIENAIAEGQGKGRAYCLFSGNRNLRLGESGGPISEPVRSPAKIPAGCVL